MFEAEEFAELIHGTATPLPRLYDAQDFNHAESFRCTPGTVCTRDFLGGIVQNLGEVVIREGAVRLTFQTVLEERCVSDEG